MILLVTHFDDEHGSAVAARLEASSSPFVRVDPSRPGAGEFYAIDPGDGGFDRGRVCSFRRTADAGRPLQGPAFDAVYWRRPLRAEDRLRMSFPSSGDVSAAEAYHTFCLAVGALPARFFPLGHPEPMDRSSNKLRQLHLARHAGFAVPETVVGNDPLVLQDFLARHRRVVVKPLHASASYRPEDRGTVDQLLWCRGFAAEELRAHLRPGQSSQLLVQEAVPKVRDWRITVLPHRTICCEIDTSSLPPDEPDWRKRTMELPHTIIEVPAALETMLREFLRLMNLPAGYFDFAIGTDGVPRFLEMNTNAQWLWIERLTGFPISEEIARCLRSAA